MSKENSNKKDIPVRKDTLRMDKERIYKIIAVKKINYKGKLQQELAFIAAGNTK